MRGWGDWMALNVYVWVIEGGETPVIVDTGIKDLELLQRSTKRSMAARERRDDFEVHRWTQEASEKTAQALKGIGVDTASEMLVSWLHEHFPR